VCRNVGECSTSTGAPRTPPLLLRLAKQSCYGRESGRCWVWPDPEVRLVLPVWRRSRSRRHPRHGQPFAVGSRGAKKANGANHVELCLGTCVHRRVASRVERSAQGAPLGGRRRSSVCLRSLMGPPLSMRQQRRRHPDWALPAHARSLVRSPGPRSRAGPCCDPSGRKSGRRPEAAGDSHLLLPLGLGALHQDRISYGTIYYVLATSLRYMTILRLDCVATPRQGSMSIPSTDCEC
jgi:hypothetical protein